MGSILTPEEREAIQHFLKGRKLMSQQTSILYRLLERDEGMSHALSDRQKEELIKALRKE